MELDKVAILIKKAALEFDKSTNALLERYDLTTPQYKVMKYLYEESDKGVRIVDLEKYYSMTHPTTIGIVQNLEKKGLVEYRNNPDNARSRFIVPTAEANRLKEELILLGEEMEQALTENLTPEEKDEMITLLKKMLGIS